MGVTGCDRGGDTVATVVRGAGAWLAPAQGLGQSLHVGRAGAAAAADQARAGIGHLAAQGGKIIRGGQIQGAAVDPLGEARVGKGRKRPVGGRCQAPQDQQQFTRPGTAVGADGSRRRGGQLPCGCLDAQTVAGEAAFHEGQLGNGRQAEFPGDLEGQPQFGHAGEGFEQETVDAAVGEGGHLLAEQGAPGYRHRAPVRCREGGAGGRRSRRRNVPGRRRPGRSGRRRG